MEQEQFKNTENNFRTDAKNLLEEMKPILSDFFVCDLSEAENAISMRLANGQTFKLKKIFCEIFGKMEYFLPSIRLIYAGACLPELK